MISVTPDFQFSGNCEEAIRFYEKVFNTKADFILRYSDAKKEDFVLELTEQEKNFVYHAEMKIGSQRIMFADVITFKIEQGNSLFLTITFDSKEEVEKAYNILKEDGRILVPLRKTTYSSAACSLIDKFGIRWGLMTECTKE